TLCNAHCLRRDGDSGVVEGSHRGLEAGSGCPDHPGLRDAYGVQVDLAGRRTLDSKLLLWGAEGHSDIGLLNHKRAEALGASVWIRHHEHGVEVRQPGVGDPAFDAVQDEIVAVAYGPGPHACYV